MEELHFYSGETNYLNKMLDKINELVRFYNLISPMIEAWAENNWNCHNDRPWSEVGSWHLERDGLGDWVVVPDDDGKDSLYGAEAQDAVRTGTLKELGIGDDPTEPGHGT